MAKVYVVIHVDALGEAYKVSATDGKRTMVWPASNTPVRKIEKAMKQMFNKPSIWIAKGNRDAK